MNFYYKRPIYNKFTKRKLEKSSNFEQKKKIFIINTPQL